ncbi:winged helix-turn-helix domain-containing protein [Runella sp.]|uniref:winged helix-turn-helix domain-containing protein n=1 Tax=Runella sp. TaxID=1960881 RepID=UPI003D117DF4
MEKPIRHLLKNLSFSVKGSLWIESTDERFLGPGRVELLEYIDEMGSINKAAKQMGMSYKKAWELVNSLNSQSDVPLVITQTGGEKGGGAVITKEARELIAFYHRLRQRFQVFLEEETNQLNNNDCL